MTKKSKARPAEEPRLPSSQSQVMPIKKTKINAGVFISTPGSSSSSKEDGARRGRTSTSW